MKSRSKLTPDQRRTRDAIRYLRKYFNTYPKQFGYLDYGPKTIIQDTLYGLGVALSGKFRFADGFEKFKTVLLRILIDERLNKIMLLGAREHDQTVVREQHAAHQEKRPIHAREGRKAVSRLSRSRD